MADNAPNSANNAAEVSKPKLPENPNLKKAILAMKENNNKETLNTVINEAVRATFVCPAVLAFEGAPPLPNEKGQIHVPKNTKINFQMVTTKDQKRYFIAFTDEEAVRSWKEANGKQLMFIRFDDFASMIERTPEVEGLIINPLTENLRFERKMILAIKEQRDAMAKKAEEAKQKVAEAARPKLPENPDFKKALLAMKENNNKDTLNAVINEAVKAVFVSPAVFEFGDTPPIPDENGHIKIPKDTKIHFQMVTTSEKKKYFMAFSDEEAVRAWKDSAGKQLMFIRFDDFSGMIERNPEAEGLVINPFTENLRFERKLILAVKEQRDALAAGRVMMKVNPGDKVTIVEPTVLPDDMLNPICDILKEHESIAAAYFQIMIINDTQKSYLIVLDGPKDQKLFDKVADSARAYMQTLPQEKRMNLNITISASPLGQQGMRGSEPFYRKGEGRIYDEDDED